MGRLAGRRVRTGRRRCRDGMPPFGGGRGARDVVLPERRPPAEAAGGGPCPWRPGPRLGEAESRRGRRSWKRIREAGRVRLVILPVPYHQPTLARTVRLTVRAGEEHLPPGLNWRRTRSRGPLRLEVRAMLIPAVRIHQSRPGSRTRPCRCRPQYGLPRCCFAKESRCQGGVGVVGAWWAPDRGQPPASAAARRRLAAGS